MNKEIAKRKKFFVYVEELIGGILAAILMALYLFQTITGWPREDERFDDFMGKFMGRGSRDKYPQNSTVKGRFYCWGLKNLISRLTAFLWLRQTRGQENIPSKGAFLVVPNHQSYLDFMLVIFALRKVKNLTFFVKVPYFDIPLWKFFLAPMGHIRADRTSIRKAFLLLMNEELPVVLFAEGTRTRTGKVGDAYPGFGRIAKKIPTLKIIPVGISGAFKLWPWDSKFPKLSGRKVKISVGKPITFIEFGGNEEEFSSMIMKQIERLVN